MVQKNGNLDRSAVKIPGMERGSFLDCLYERSKQIFDWPAPAPNQRRQHHIANLWQTTPVLWSLRRRVFTIWGTEPKKVGWEPNPNASNKCTY